MATIEVPLAVFAGPPRQGGFNTGVGPMREILAKGRIPGRLGKPNGDATPVIVDTDELKQWLGTRAAAGMGYSDQGQAEQLQESFGAKRRK